MHERSGVNSSLFLTLNEFFFGGGMFVGANELKSERGELLDPTRRIRPSGGRKKLKEDRKQRREDERGL